MTTITTYQAVPPLPLTAPFDATLEPAAYLVQALEYIAALDERPTPDYCREVAALEDAITYPDELQEARYAHHRTQLLNGAALATATPDELRRDALALFGLAKDRQVNGDWALEPEVWVNAASEALEQYRTRKALASGASPYEVILAHVAPAFLGVGEQPLEVVKTDNKDAV